MLHAHAFPLASTTALYNGRSCLPVVPSIAAMHSFHSQLTSSNLPTLTLFEPICSQPQPSLYLIFYTAQGIVQVLQRSTCYPATRLAKKRFLPPFSLGITVSNELEEINLGLVMTDYVKFGSQPGMRQATTRESVGDCRKRLWLALSTTGERLEQGSGE